jgi:cytochrome c peroxidase
MTRRTVSTVLALALAITAAPAGAADADLRDEASALFGQLAAPDAEALSSPEIRLGRTLFWDERISADGKTACASCHSAADWSADRRRASVDARGASTPRHSQPVFNALLQPSLRWRGDRKDGAAQAEGSLTGSMGFATKADGVEAMRRHGYEPMFRAAYPRDAAPLTAANYGKALAAYQATLVTPSAFDRFLAGDDLALDGREKAGLRAFIANGCGACHSGPLLGGTSFQPFGLARPYWEETGSSKVDPGLFAATKKESDRYVFRVPMLRNVAKTAPYFHDGSVDTLAQAVRIMGRVQLGSELEDGEIAAIVAFLETLTGPVPAHYAPPGQSARAE